MNYKLRVTQAALVLIGTLGAMVELRSTTNEGRASLTEVGPPAADATDLVADETYREERPGPRIAVLPMSSTAPQPSMAIAALVEPADEAPLAPVPFTEVGLLGGPQIGFTGDRETWLAGRETFQREWKPAEGLGAPEFNGKSCSECHRDPVAGGAGGLEFNVQRGQSDGAGHSYLRSKDALKDLDKKTRKLIMAQLRENERRSRKHGKSSKESGGLQSPSLLGLGLIDTIPMEEIARNADPMDRNGDGIRGKLAMVHVRRTDGKRHGEPEVGRFGWTAEVPRLSDFVCLALGGETGITVPDQGRGFQLIEDDDDVQDPELDQAGLDELMQFMTNLAPPARAGNARAAEVEIGRRLFESIGCADCHIPSLRAENGRPVELYSDLLLHEAVVLNADDAITLRGRDGKARLRTPPLWGVRDTAPYLHDGSARTLRAAILAHDLEARPARDRFAELLEFDSSAVIAFLNDL